MPSAMMIREGVEYVPGYRTVEFLGEGNYGEVWKASAPGGAFAALKFINLRGSTGIKEFRGIQRVKTINHGNLMPITALWMLDENGDVLSDEAFDAYESEMGAAVSGTLKPEPRKGRLLVVAMLLAEQDLEKKAGEFQESDPDGLARIPPDILLGYMKQAADGIDHLNSQKRDLGDGPVSIQHCDVKPANMLLRGEVVQICDFGLAHAMRDMRLTATSVLGTPPYISPECISQKPSHASDQYSLACSYFELRTGSWPFDCESSLVKVLATHQNGKLDLSLLPERERKVIARATSVDHKRRYPSCKAMVEALEQALEPPERPGWLEESFKTLNRLLSYTPHALRAICVLAIAVALVFGVVKLAPHIPGIVEKIFQNGEVPLKERVQLLCEAKKFGDAYGLAKDAEDGELLKFVMTEFLDTTRSDKDAIRFADAFVYMNSFVEAASEKKLRKEDDKRLRDEYDQMVDAWISHVDKPDIPPEDIGGIEVIIADLHEIWQTAHHGSSLVRERILDLRDARLQQLVDSAHGQLAKPNGELGAKSAFDRLDQGIVQKATDDRKQCWVTVCALGQARVSALGCIQGQDEQVCGATLQKLDQIKEQLDQIEREELRDQQRTLLLGLRALLERSRYPGQGSLEPILSPFVERLGIKDHRRHLSCYPYETAKSDELREWLLEQAAQRWGAKTPEEREKDSEYVKLNEITCGLLALQLKRLDARKLVDDASLGQERFEMARRGLLETLEALKKREQEPVDQNALDRFRLEIDLSSVAVDVHEAFERLQQEDLVQEHLDSARKALADAQQRIDKTDPAAPGHSQTAHLLGMTQALADFKDQGRPSSEAIKKLNGVISTSPESWIWPADERLAKTLRSRLLPDALLQRLQDEVIGTIQSRGLDIAEVQQLLGLLTVDSQNQDSLEKRLAKIEIVDALSQDSVDYGALFDKCKDLAVDGAEEPDTVLDALIRLCWFECCLEQRNTVPGTWKDIAGARQTLQTKLASQSALHDYARYVLAVIAAEAVDEPPLTRYGTVAVGIGSLVKAEPSAQVSTVLRVRQRAVRAREVLWRAVVTSVEQANAKLLRNPFASEIPADAVHDYLIAYRKLLETAGQPAEDRKALEQAYSAIAAFYRDPDGTDGQALAEAIRFSGEVLGNPEGPDKAGVELFQRVLLINAQAHAKRYRTTDDKADRDSAIKAFVQFADTHEAQFEEMKSSLRLTRRDFFQGVIDPAFEVDKRFRYYELGPFRVEDEAPAVLENLAEEIKGMKPGLPEALARLHFHYAMTLLQDRHAVTGLDGSKSDVRQMTYDALLVASRLSPANLSILVQLATAYVDLPKTAEQRQKTVPHIEALLSSVEPNERNPDFLLLRGWLKHTKARSVSDGGGLLEEAKNDYDKALPKLTGRRKAETLEKISAACLELAFLHSASNAEKAGLLGLAARRAEEATKIPDRQKPEYAWIAWGNALEDEAAYLDLGRAEASAKYEEAEKKFREALTVAETMGRPLAAPLKNLGRCMYHRFNQTKTTSGDTTPQLYLNETLDILTKAQEHSTDDPATLADTCLWQGGVYECLAKVDATNGPAHLEKAEESFARAKDTAIDHDFSRWPSFVARWARRQFDQVEEKWPEGKKALKRILELAEGGKRIEPLEIRDAVLEWPDTDGLMEFYGDALKLLKLPDDKGIKGAKTAIARADIMTWRCGTRSDRLPRKKRGESVDITPEVLQDITDIAKDLREVEELASSIEDPEKGRILADKCLVEAQAANVRCEWEGTYIYAGFEATDCCEEGMRHIERLRPGVPSFSETFDFRVEYAYAVVLLVRAKVDGLIEDPGKQAKIPELKSKATFLLKDLDRLHAGDAMHTFERVKILRDLLSQ